MILEQLHYMSTVHIVLNLLNPVTANNWLVSNFSKEHIYIIQQACNEKREIITVEPQLCGLVGTGLKSWDNQESR